MLAAEPECLSGVRRESGRTHMNLRSAEVDRVVAEIDRTRRTEFWRDPDRPARQFVPARKRQDPKITRAKARARTAAWRNRLDRLRRPEATDIGMCLVAALVTSPNLLDMTEPEVRFVSVALADLAARGFDRAETLKVLRRLRNRLVDPGDRAGEESESCSQPIVPSSWKSESTIF
jgi:hypothetical protein